MLHSSSIARTPLLLLFLRTVASPAVPQVMAQPAADDFLPLTATVLVRDENTDPLDQTEVFAVNHEYGFTINATTGSEGEVTLEVMPGTWSFYALRNHGGMSSHPGKGYFLVSLDELFDAVSREVLLAPETIVTVNLVSEVFDFLARENYVGFVAEPYGRFIPARSCAVTSDVLELYTNTGLTASAFVASPRSSGEHLYFIQPAMPLASPFAIEVTNDNSAVLQFNAFDAEWHPTGYQVQLYSSDLSWAWSPSIADAPADQPTMRVAPGTYFMNRAVDAFDASSVRHRVGLHPETITVEVGETHPLYWGGPLVVESVRTTPRAAAAFSPACQLWHHMQDAFNNTITGTWNWNTGSMGPTIVVHYGASTSNPFEVYTAFCSKLLQEFDRSIEPTYEITWDFGTWGAGNVTGELYGQEERRQAIDETDALLSQSPRMDAARRQAMVDDYQQVAVAMEALIGVPVDYKLGVVSNIAHAGFEDEVQHGYKLEIGIDMVTPTGWAAGSGFNDHEAGHGRIHKPPCRFSYRREAYATLLGKKARSVLYGGPEHLKYLLGQHTLFLRHQHGQPLQSAGDYIETMQFITHYINTHYGWEPHRRMVLEWANAFRSIHSLLANGGFSSIESFAIVYSWLCSDNLGALFEAAGFDASAVRIDAGLILVRDYLGAFSETTIGIGVNRVETPRTSIPIELVATPHGGISEVDFTVSYDPSQAAVTAVYHRDVTDRPDWSMVVGTGTPGVVHVHLRGDESVSAPGSVAQINFRLLPDASGSLEFTLRDVTANGQPVATVDGSLGLPMTPLIGPFPTLAQAGVGAAYVSALWATGGAPPYQWEVVEDALPPGMELDPAGHIYGQPTTIGESLFRVQVTDDLGHVAHRWHTIVVGLAGDLDADGDVDIQDFTLLSDCMKGPAGGYTEGCEIADWNADRDVDLKDLSSFQVAFFPAAR